MGDALNAPVSLRAYYRKIWNKAKQLEEGKWRKRAIAEVAIAILGLVVIGYFLGPERVITARTIAWLFIGIGLISIAFWRFAVFLIRAPHQIHLDDQAKLLESESERQKAIAERDAALHAFDDERYRVVASIFNRLSVEDKKWLHDLLVRPLMPAIAGPGVLMLRDEGIVFSEGLGSMYTIVPPLRPIVQRLLRECDL